MATKQIWGASQITGVPWHIEWHTLQVLWSGPGSHIVTRDLESFLGHLCHAARVVCKGRPFFGICFLSFLRLGLHWKGCLQIAGLSLELNVFMWFTKSRQSALRRQLSLLPPSFALDNTFEYKERWLINKILWTLPSSWKLLELNSDFKTHHYGHIWYHRWRLHPGRRAGYHDEDISLPTVYILLLIKPCFESSEYYAGRSVLHPLSREATAHVSFSNTRSNSKTSKLSWQMFITVSTLERMMISVWDRSRNVSLIDHWKSSACYSHMAMLAWPMARKSHVRR